MLFSRKFFRLRPWLNAAGAAALVYAATVVVLLLACQPADEEEEDEEAAGCVRETLEAHGLASADELPPSLPLEWLCRQTSTEAKKKMITPPPHPTKLLFGNFNWQLLRTSERQVAFLYSAFLDDRPALMEDDDKSPKVRILGMVDSHREVLQNLFPTEAELELESAFGCVFWHDDGESATSAEAAVSSVRRGLDLRPHDVHNYSFVFSCDAADAERPIFAVSLVEAGREDAAITNVLRLEDNRPAEGEEKGFLAACVKPSWFSGEVEEAQRLAEWVELQLILGVEKVYVSPFNVDGPAERLLAHYRDRGKVELMQPFSFAVVEKMTFSEQRQLGKNDGGNSFDDVRFFTEDLVHTHCVLSNLHRFEYVAVLDVDEVIYPVRDDNLPAVISRLERDHYNRRPSEFTFKAFYFLDEMMSLDDLADVPAHEHLSSRRMRGPALPLQYVQAKSVVKTSDAVTAWAHGGTTCAVRWRFIDECARSWADPDQHAFLAHYRGACKADELFTDEVCAQCVANATRDDVVERFSGRLKERTRATLAELNMLP